MGSNRMHIESCCPLLYIFDFTVLSAPSFGSISFIVCHMNWWNHAIVLFSWFSILRELWVWCVGVFPRSYHAAVSLSAFTPIRNSLMRMFREMVYVFFVGLQSNQSSGCRFVCVFRRLLQKIMVAAALAFSLLDQFCHIQRRPSNLARCKCSSSAKSFQLPF